MRDYLRHVRVVQLAPLDVNVEVNVPSVREPPMLGVPRVLPHICCWTISSRPFANCSGPE